MLPVDATSVHPCGFPKHVGYLLNAHMDPILFKESCDLPAVESTAPIFIELGEHVVNDIVSFYFGARLVVMRVGVLHRSCFEPLFIRLSLQLQLARSAEPADFRWGRLFCVYERFNRFLNIFALDFPGLRGVHQVGLRLELGDRGCLTRAVEDGVCIGALDFP